MPHTIERIGNELAVMDEDGEVCEAVAITSRRQAKRQIAAWTRTYVFDYAAAMRLIQPQYGQELLDFVDKIRQRLN
jgi:hypothetical protein